MAAAGSPWSARRVGHTTIQEVVRKTLLTYWNTVAFQVLYANPVIEAQLADLRYVRDRLAKLIEQFRASR